jgi:hypothetical protein
MLYTVTHKKLPHTNKYVYTMRNAPMQNNTKNMTTVKHHTQKQTKVIKVDHALEEMEKIKEIQ